MKGILFFVIILIQYELHLPGDDCRPNLIRLIAKGYAQIVSDVSVDVSDVSEVLLTGLSGHHVNRLLSGGSLKNALGYRIDVWVST